MKAVPTGDDDRFGLTPMGEALLRPGSPEKIESLARESAADASEAIGLTVGPSDDRETRLRALFALFHHEAGLDVSDTTICALAAATRRMGYAFVPVRR